MMNIILGMIVIAIIVIVIGVDYFDEVERQRIEEEMAVKEIQEAMRNGDDVVIFDDGSYAIRMKGSK